MEAVSRNLKEIKKLGIKITMDDFGTGFSSLSMLLNLEIDKIKIDRLFIKNIGNSREEKIIKTMVSRAKKLGVGGVPEGVEREQELTFLKSIVNAGKDIIGRDLCLLMILGICLWGKQMVNRYDNLSRAELIQRINELETILAEVTKEKDSLKEKLFKFSISDV
jgi:hypothetical protein